jgi:D-aspartate ligase
MTRPKAFVVKGVPAPFHHGALAVGRTLGRKGVAVAANDESPRAPARYSRYRSEGVVWDPWPQDPASIVERLLEWGERQDQPALLIPVDDASTIAVDTHRADLATTFRFPQLPVGLAEQLSSKWGMAQLAEAHGVATARVARLDSDAPLDDLLEQFGLPVVVKRISGWSADSRGTPSVTLARTKEDVLSVAAGGADNLLLQEYIPGGSNASWMFNGYFDAESKCLFGLTGYKVRQYPVDGGFTTFGRLELNEELLRSAIAFFAAVGYVGIVDVGFRLDARDSSYKLLDVNPRVGSTFRLFAAEDGRDLVSTCYDDLIGGDPGPPVLAAPTRTWQVEPHDLRAVRSLRRSRGDSPLRAVWSAARASERAWWAADDPKPFLVGAAHGCARSLKGERTGGRPKPGAGSAETVRERFEEDAAYWRDVYEPTDDVDAQVYQERLSRALQYVDGLGLRNGAHVLDVGAGAGVAAVALAARGYEVIAVDAAVSMLDLTKQRAAAEGVSLATVHGDAGHLPIADATVDVVVALGLLPWIEDPSSVLREFGRVLHPGGVVILSSDNRWRLNEAADPALSALAAPLRRRIAPRLRRVRGRQHAAFAVQRHSLGELRDLLELAGFEVVAASTLGYGPITFMRRPVLTGSFGLRLAAALSRRSGSPLLRLLGVHVVASARLRA